MIYKGHNGQVEVLDDAIVISRKGLLGLMTQGLKGDKRIPFHSITAVQFKAANPFFNGYIQFTISGGIENRGGLSSAGTDENSVMFRVGNQANQFQQLRDIVQSKIENRSNTPSISAADEIEKFASLRDRGLISDEEFALKKSKLLGLT